MLHPDRIDGLGKYYKMIINNYRLLTAAPLFMDNMYLFVLIYIYIYIYIYIVKVTAVVVNPSYDDRSAA